jgi:protein-L-isoaspartate(D-aspartate) O-methyltransferase
MIIPLGERYQQTLYLLKKVNGKMETEALEPTFFVPMTGQAEALREGKDPAAPQVVNGSFEEKTEGLLAPWYYVRQAEVVEDSQAPDGSRILRFRNETPGRGAQALQALAMDGRQVEQIELSAWVATDSIRRGSSRHETPRVELTFFDERRALVGTQTLGPWFGTSGWKQQRATLRVPPKARLCVLGVGMFGAVGQLSIYDVSIKATAARSSSAVSQ